MEPSILSAALSPLGYNFCYYSEQFKTIMSTAPKSIAENALKTISSVKTFPRLAEILSIATTAFQTVTTVETLSIAAATSHALSQVPSLRKYADKTLYTLSTAGAVRSLHDICQKGVNIESGVLAAISAIFAFSVYQRHTIHDEFKAKLEELKTAHETAPEERIPKTKHDEEIGELETKFQTDLTDLQTEHETAPEERIPKTKHDEEINGLKTQYAKEKGLDSEKFKRELEEKEKQLSIDYTCKLDLQNRTLRAALKREQTTALEQQGLRYKQDLERTKAAYNFELARIKKDLENELASHKSSEWAVAKFYLGKIQEERVLKKEEETEDTLSNRLNDFLDSLANHENESIQQMRTDFKDPNNSTIFIRHSKKLDDKCNFKSKNPSFNYAISDAAYLIHILKTVNSELEQANKNLAKVLPKRRRRESKQLPSTLIENAQNYKKNFEDSLIPPIAEEKTTHSTPNPFIEKILAECAKRTIEKKLDDIQTFLQKYCNLKLNLPNPATE